MAVKKNELQAHLDQLNDYHLRLASCAALSAFLLDCAEEKSDQEWHRAGAWLMRNMLLDLVEGLPFPSV